MLRIGVDIGYNKTKVVTALSYRIFASAVGTCFEHQFSMSRNGNGIAFETPREVAIGEQAIQFSQFAHRREDRDWIKSEEYYMLWLAALSEATHEPTAQIRAVTGLPVSFFGDKDILMNGLRGVHSFCRAGQSPQVLHISELVVLPQPFGTLLDSVLNEYGKVGNPRLAQAHVGIIDVGGKTTNFLHAYKLSDVPAETTSIDAGGWDVVRRVADYLAQYNLNLRDHEIAELLITRYVAVRGERIELGDVIDEAAQQLAESVISAASQRWNGANRMDSIIVTGGGASLIGEAICKYYPHAVIADEPELANARGFFKYAQRG